MTRAFDVSPISAIARSAAKGIYVLAVAALASIVAAVAALHIVFDRAFLADFDGHGFAVLLLVFEIGIVPGFIATLATHGFLANWRGPRWREFPTYGLFAAALSYGWLVARAWMNGGDLAGAFSEMAAYTAVSGALAGLLLWLLAGRWRKGRAGLEVAA